MWSSYSASAAAQLIGLPESAVRRCIRVGLVGRIDEVPSKLSFRDLAALRALRELIDQGLPMARARRELLRLMRELPSGGSLAELPLEVRFGRVQIRGRIPSGQLELPLEPDSAAPAGDMRSLRELSSRPMASIRVADHHGDSLEPAQVVTADEWFARALAVEEQRPPTAIEAYRRALRLRPDWSDAWINLGRLLAEHGDPSGAGECFEAALALDPVDATAIYNLGVVSQDTGAEQLAISHYKRALELDPALAEAHYNLATLFDRIGDARAAIRHINEYRKLTRG